VSSPFSPLFVYSDNTAAISGRSYNFPRPRGASTFQFSCQAAVPPLFFLLDPEDELNPHLLHFLYDATFLYVLFPLLARHSVHRSAFRRGSGRPFFCWSNLSYLLSISIVVGHDRPRTVSSLSRGCYIRLQKQSFLVSPGRPLSPPRDA